MRRRASTLPPMPVPIALLVHPEADRWLSAQPDLNRDLTTATSAKEARAFLAGTAFDLVVVGPDVEGAEAIAALRDVLGLATRIETVERLDDVGALLADPPASDDDLRETLEGIRGELGRVAHALNNPLAVISGNAQLGLEMAAATGADETVSEALSTIADAAARLERLFADVAALRARVGQALGR